MTSLANIRRVAVAAVSSLVCAFCLSSCCYIRFREGADISSNVKLTVIRGEGDVQASYIDILPYKEISVSIPADVKWTYEAEHPFVEIFAEDNILEYVDANVKDGVLTIGSSKNVALRSEQGISAVVHGPVPRAVSVAGSGSCTLSRIETDGDLSVSIAGSGNVNAPEGIECGNLSASIAGGGTINLNGVKADEASASVVGSGSMAFENVNVGKIGASISGSGIAKIAGKAESAGLGITGSGVIDASRLDCGNISSEVTGSGIIHTKGSKGR